MQFFYLHHCVQNKLDDKLCPAPMITLSECHRPLEKETL